MVGIGGVRGSGTRVIVDILKQVGYFMGNDLNESNDNLLFTLMFKRENILTATDDDFFRVWEIFKKIMCQKSYITDEEYNILEQLASEDRTLHHKQWLKDRLLKLNYDLKNTNLVGFKEPNSHIVVEKIIKIDNNIKYIYVYRNGLDMAYSSNQNQLKLWGDIFLNKKNIDINPKNSLKYWCIVHERMLQLKKKYSNNIYMLDFDDLCLNKEKTLNNLLKFLNIDYKLDSLKSIIKVPSSIGRYKKFNLSVFDSDNLDYIEKIYKNKKEIN